MPSVGICGNATNFESTSVNNPALLTLSINAFASIGSRGLSSPPPTGIDPESP